MQKEKARTFVRYLKKEMKCGQNKNPNISKALQIIMRSGSKRNAMKATTHGTPLASLHLTTSVIFFILTLSKIILHK
jgi:hypothetical protein